MSLPHWQDRLHSKRRAIVDEIESLPEEIADNLAQRKLLSICNEFLAEVSDYTFGGSKHPELFKAVSRHYEKFKKRLETTELIFDVSSVSTTTDNTYTTFEHIDNYNSQGIHVNTSKLTLKVLSL
jgi:hypothetical protein